MHTSHKRPFFKRLKTVVKDVYIQTLYRIQRTVEGNFRYLRALSKNGFKSRVVLCYPERPTPMHALYMILSELGCRITTNPNKKVDLCIYFEDATLARDDATLKKLVSANRVVNGRCLDISKSKVQEEFEKAFGYSLKIDPSRHTGVCLRKSDTNAAHDGVVLQCPIAPEHGYVYQKLINNVRNERAVDIRFFIHGKTIAYAYQVERSLNDRFDVVVGNPRAVVSEHISESERTALFRFCDAMGLDYGDLDTLRDNDDGRLYIVDTNKTPYGPRLGAYVDRPEYNHFIDCSSNAFLENCMYPVKR